MRRWLYFRAMPRLLTVLLAASFVAVPKVGLFNPMAMLDVSEVVFIPGERWCPKLGTWDEEKLRPGKCLVDLVEGKKPIDKSRPDWAAAMQRCAAAGFSQVECEESVGDGEF